MNGARHNSLRENESAKQVLKKLGGDLNFWSYFVSRFQTYPGSSFRYFKKADFARVRRDAQSLHGSLAKLGLPANAPLMLILGNLQTLFEEDNRFALDIERGGKDNILNPEYLSLPKKKFFARQLFTPSNLGYKEAVSFGTGRFPKDLRLYYFVPALVAYTKYLCGEPRWALISRLLSEELHASYSDSDLKRWWAESIEVLTENRYMKLDSARKQLMTAVYMYPWWKRNLDLGLLDRDGAVCGGDSVIKVKDASPLSREEVRYYKTVHRVCPFYSEHVVPVRFTLPSLKKRLPT